MESWSHMCSLYAHQVQMIHKISSFYGNSTAIFIISHTIANSRFPVIPFRFFVLILLLMDHYRVKNASIPWKTSFNVVRDSKVRTDWESSGNFWDNRVGCRKETCSVCVYTCMGPNRYTCIHTYTRVYTKWTNRNKARHWLDKRYANSGDFAWRLPKILSVLIHGDTRYTCIHTVFSCNVNTRLFPTG